MRQDRPAQLTGLEESGRTETPTGAETEREAENSARETQPVITGWVRDHEHRSEEYRRAFKDLLTEEGFISSRTASRPGK